MKKALGLLLITLLCLLCMTGVALAAPQVILNGTNLTFDVPPVIEDGRTLVPLRTIFEAIGADISWDPTTKTVTATKADTEIKLTIGGKAYKNGQPVALGVPAKIINDRTLVPLRFVSEALGCQVSWDGSTQIITITTVGGSVTQIKVHFIDVGQADSIYIDLPDNIDILIDGGNTGDGPAVVNYLINQGVDDIELLIATHPHEDHIGGLPAVFDAFQIEKIIDSGNYVTSKTYYLYQEKKRAEAAFYEEDNYQSYTWGNNTLKIYIGAETWEDVNDYSDVCRLDTGNIEFLFTGDAGTPVESMRIGDLSADILKVGHHGSTSSTGSWFLSKINPQVAVISVGTGNTYGHLAKETITKLQDIGANIYRTDLNGNIVISTDGYSYNVETEKDFDMPVEEIRIPSFSPPPVPEVVVSGAYVGSIKSDKYHLPTCRYGKTIAPYNEIWFKDEVAARAAGYVPCKSCKP